MRSTHSEVIISSLFCNSVVRSLQKIVKSSLLKVKLEKLIYFQQVANTKSMSLRIRFWWYIQINYKTFNGWSSSNNFCYKIIALGIQIVTISIDNNSMNAAVTDWATAGHQLHPKMQMCSKTQNFRRTVLTVINSCVFKFLPSETFYRTSFLEWSIHDHWNPSTSICIFDGTFYLNWTRFNICMFLW